MTDRFGTISITPDHGAIPPRPKKTGPRPKPAPRPAAKKGPTGPRKPRRGIFLAAIPLLLAALYCLFGFFFAPSWLTGYISDTLEQATGLGVTAGKARFNPFTLHLELDDIATTGGDQGKTPATPLVTIDHFSIDLNLVSLLRNGIACNSLEIQGLAAAVIRYPDASYNLPARVSGRTDTGAEPLSLSSLPPLFSLNNIKISDSKLLFDDQLTGKQHRVEQIKLDLPSLSNFSFAASDYIRPHFSAVINGSPMELTGETALPGESGGKGMKTNLSCNLQNLDLPLYFAYLPKSVPLLLNKGKGAGKVQLTFTPKGKAGGDLSIGFQLTATEIGLSTTEQTMSMTAPAVEITGDLQPLAGALHLNRLHLSQPQVTADKAHLPQDLARLFTRTETAETPPDKKRQLAIDALTVENGTVQLIDKQQKTAPHPWTALELMVKDFRLAPAQDDSKGSFSLSGKQETTNAILDWQGTFTAKGLPDGTFRLNAIPAGTLFSFLGLDQSTEAEGTASLKGRLTLNPGAKDTGMATVSDAVIDIQGLTLTEKKQLWLTAKSVQCQDVTFTNREAEIGAISLQDSALSLRQGQLPQFLKALDAAKKPLLLHSFDYSGKATLFPGKDKGKPLQLGELQVKINNLTAKTAAQSNLELTARVNDSGLLKAQGLATLFPLRASLSLVFSAIAAEPIAPWLPDTPLFQLGRATMQGKGTYRFPESSFTGTLQLTDALIRATGNSPGLTVNKATMNNLAITSGPLRVGMNELALDGAKFTWEKETDSPEPFAQFSAFLRNLLADAPEKEGHAQKQTAPVFPVIPKLTFNDATINYVEHRLTPPWSVTLQQVQGSIDNLHEKNNGGGPDTIFAVAGLMETTPFTLSGGADLLKPQGNFTLQLELKEFPLNTFSPQLTPLLDVDPKSGSCELTLAHSRQNGDEQGQATFVLSRLRPSSAHADTALPLALLTDGQDRIQLQAPLARNSAQPLLKQAISAFQTLRVKADVAPLLLAGTEFADLQDKLAIPFPPGGSELSPQASRELLRRFAALLAARPHLGLTLTGVADPVQDRAVIQKALEEKERQRVAVKNEQRMQEWQKKQAEKQKAPPKNPPPGKIIEQNINPQELSPPTPLQPEPVTVSDARLHDLAQERALQVYDVCTSELDMPSGRIILQEKTRISGPDTPGAHVAIGLTAIEQ